MTSTAAQCSPRAEAHAYMGARPEVHAARVLGDVTSGDVIRGKRARSLIIPSLPRRDNPPNGAGIARGEGRARVISNVKRAIEQILPTQIKGQTKKRKKQKTKTQGLLEARGMCRTKAIDPPCLTLKHSTIQIPSAGTGMHPIQGGKHHIDGQILMFEGPVSSNGR